MNKHLGYKDMKLDQSYQSINVKSKLGVFIRYIGMTTLCHYNDERINPCPA